MTKVVVVGLSEGDLPKVPRYRRGLVPRRAFYCQGVGWEGERDGGGKRMKLWNLGRDRHSRDKAGTGPVRAVHRGANSRQQFIRHPGTTEQSDAGLQREEQGKRR